MNLQQFSRKDGRFVRQYDYGNTTVVAADVEDHSATVDVIGDTAIVVGDDGEQFELELPESSDAQAFINNGILTIEVTTA
jgi:translation elongation factor P/translation initiation factor 5A